MIFLNNNDFKNSFSNSDITKNIPIVELELQVDYKDWTLGFYFWD